MLSQDIWHPRIYGTPIPYILGYVAPPSDIWYPHTNYPRTFSTPHAFELQLYFNINIIVNSDGYKANDKINDSIIIEISKYLRTGNTAMPSVW